MKLIQLNEKHENEWLLYCKEVLDSDKGMYPMSLNYQDYPDYKKWLETEKRYNTGIGIDPNHVKGTTYCLVDDEEIIYGAINIRHSLNDFLRRAGGHIGYGIRPSKRRKGYATLMLKLALPICKSLGIDKVMIVCDADNVASENNILKNGGIYDSTVIDDGVEVKRFYIDI